MVDNVMGCGFCCYCHCEDVAFATISWRGKVSALQVE